MIVSTPPFNDKTLSKFNKSAEANTNTPSPGGGIPVTAINSPTAAPPSSGKNKKKRKRRSKSERKRRKREREAAEAKTSKKENEQKQEQQQQQDGGDADDKQQQKDEVKVPKPSKKKNTINNNDSNDHDVRHKSSKNGNSSIDGHSYEQKTDSLAALETSTNNDTTTTTLTKNKSDKDEGHNNKNGIGKINMNIDKMQLLEFVYPKLQTNVDSGGHSAGKIFMKPYVHSKLRKLQKSRNEKESNTANSNVDGIVNNNKQKAISMGVANESINDILSPTKKAAKALLKDYGSEDDEENEEQKEVNNDDDGTTANNNTKSVSVTEEKEESEPDGPKTEVEKEEQLEVPSSSTLFAENNNAEVETSPSKEKQIVKVASATAAVAEKDKLGFSPPSATSSISAKRKRSMSEDSGNEEMKILSGISVEMAVNDKFGRRPRCNSTDGELNLPRRGLCDEQKVMAFHKWDMNKFRPSPPRGFHNLGNTCFLNATLQCLAHLPTFCQCVANIDPSKQRVTKMNGKKKKLSNGQLVTLALRNLLHNVHGLNNDKAPKQSAISPKVIANSISLIDGSNRGYKFRPGRQEDAHEFLVHLLDAMNEGELNAAGINQKKSGWRDRLPIPRLDETTFVRRMFGGYLRSQVCCTKCNYKSNTYDPFLDLSLEVSSKKVNSIHTAFKEFTRKETLDAANKWECSGCKRRVCATKQLTCFRPPLSLCIQLKRFSFGGGMGGYGYMHHQFGYSHFAGKGMGMRKGGSKIEKPIDFPAELKLPLSDGRKCEYQLTGVVIHVGHNATSGHYTAFIRRPTKKGADWYHMDDSFVDPVKEKTVLRQKNAYVLFYCRKEVKLNLPNPPTIFSSTEQAKMAGEAKARARSLSEDKTQTLLSESPLQRSEPQTPKKGLLSQDEIEESRKVSQIPQAQLDGKSDTAGERILTQVENRALSPNDEKASQRNSKEDQGSKRGSKALTLDQGSKHGSVQVYLRKLKKNKAVWKPSYSSGSDMNRSLLGNTSISTWDDEDDEPATERDALLREAALKEEKQQHKKRKRKMYLDSWDAGLDKGRTKKVKEKRPKEIYEQAEPNQNQFHRLQSTFMQMGRKGKHKSYANNNHNFNKKKRKIRR